MTLHKLYDNYYNNVKRSDMQVHACMCNNLCTYQWHPPLPHPRVAWGNSGDLTEYHIKNPSPGVLPDVNTPISRQESIGGIDRGFDIIRLYYANNPRQFHLHSGGRGELLPIPDQFLCIARGWGTGGGGGY